MWRRSSERLLGRRSGRTGRLRRPRGDVARGELGAGDPSGCGGPFVHIGSGAGDGFKSDVVYAVDGSRVAVLLLNGRTPGGTGFARSAAAANSLYCAA